MSSAVEARQTEPLNVERLERAAELADRHGWSGPTIRERRRRYAERIAAEYARLTHVEEPPDADPD